MRVTRRSPKFNFSNSSVLTVVVTLFIISVFIYFLLSWNKCTESFETTTNDYKIYKSSNGKYLQVEGNGNNLRLRTDNTSYDLFYISNNKMMVNKSGTYVYLGTSTNENPRFVELKDAATNVSFDQGKIKVGTKFLILDGNDVKISSSTNPTTWTEITPTSAPAPKFAPSMAPKFAPLSYGSSNLAPMVAPGSKLTVTFINNTQKDVYVRYHLKKGDTNRIKVNKGGRQTIQICNDNECEIRVHDATIYYKYNSNGNVQRDNRNRKIEYRTFLAEISTKSIKSGMSVTLNEDNTILLS